MGGYCRNCIPTKIYTALQGHYMQKNNGSHSKKLTDKLLLSIDEKYPVSLFHGKMGLCIYLYHLSKIEYNPE